jgi:hypothetical protein
MSLNHGRTGRVVACGVALVVALGVAPRSARAKSCAGVSAKRHVYQGIAVHNSLTCARARTLIRRWDRTRFPHSQTGWYCQMNTRRKLCSEGNGAAPYFRFVRRRR